MLVHPTVNALRMSCNFTKREDSKSKKSTKLSSRTANCYHTVFPSLYQRQANVEGFGRCLEFHGAPSASPVLVTKGLAASTSITPVT